MPPVVAKRSRPQIWAMQSAACLAGAQAVAILGFIVFYLVRPAELIRPECGSFMGCTPIFLYWGSILVVFPFAAVLFGTLALANGRHEAWGLLALVAVNTIPALAGFQYVSSGDHHWQAWVALEVGVATWVVGFLWVAGSWKTPGKETRNH